MTARLHTLICAAAILAAAPAEARDCATDQRAFAHVAGTSCIPIAPQAIVALRGDALVTPLLDIGAPVIGGAMVGAADGSAYVRGARDIFGQAFVDAAGLANIGHPGQPDFEAIAAARPDLILAMATQMAAYDRFDTIAPTVVIPGNVPYLDHLAMVADAAGRSDRYDARLADYRARIEDAKARIGDPASITVSRFDIAVDGLWYYPYWGALDQVIADIGFARPALQAEATDELNAISVERIEDFDGDILLSSYAPHFAQDIDDLEALYDRVAPFWRDLPGVQAGGHYWYPRDIWNGRSFASLFAAIDGLVLLTAGRDGPYATGPLTVD